MSVSFRHLPVSASRREGLCSRFLVSKLNSSTLSLLSSRQFHSLSSRNPLASVVTGLGRRPLRIFNEFSTRQRSTLSPSSAHKTKLPPFFFSQRSGTVSLFAHRPNSTLPQSSSSSSSDPLAKRRDLHKQNGEEDEEDADPPAFARTTRASQAAQLNLSARLSKDGKGKQALGGNWSDVWRLIKIAAPEKKPLSFAFGCLLISSSVSMSIPFAIGKILDMASKQDGTPDLLLGMDPTLFYLGLGSALAIGALSNFGRIVQLRIVGERIVTRLRTRLYRHTLVQDAEFFDANRVGDLISRLGSDTVIVGKSITQNLSDGLRSFVSGAAGLTLMGYVSLKLTGLLALMFPPIAIGAFFYGRGIRALSRKIQKNLGTLTKIAEERLGNIRTIQAFAGETQEVRRYNVQTRKIFTLGRKEAYMSATFFGASGFAGNITILLMLYVGGGMVKSGAISVGELTSFMMYTAYAGSSLFGLSGFYSELMKGVGAASRLFELVDRKPHISLTKGVPIASAKGPIEFRNLSFSYPTRPAVKIFNELSFTIESGSHVAVVAPSGAGKSTVASLLLRFYDPTGGKILIDGRDIGTMNVQHLRRRIGYVGQEPVLFSGTIAENIAYGRPTASVQSIVQAARQANCGFIADFPDGLDTFVGARGTQLSGGQKQRIAIARALLKEPDILILDEATSALDAESETLVNQALGRLETEGEVVGPDGRRRRETTIISIAHRLSTIQRADRVICLSAEGRVAEEGTYEELESRDGPFKQLMEWQMHGTLGGPAGKDGAGRETGPEGRDGHNQGAVEPADGRARVGRRDQGGRVSEREALEFELEQDRGLEEEDEDEKDRAR